MYLRPRYREDSILLKKSHCCGKSKRLLVNVKTKVGGKTANVNPSFFLNTSASQLASPLFSTSPAMDIISFVSASGRSLSTGPNNCAKKGKVSTFGFGIGGGSNFRRKRLAVG